MRVETINLPTRPCDSLYCHIDVTALNLIGLVNRVSESVRPSTNAPKKGEMGHKPSYLALFSSRTGLAFQKSRRGFIALALFSF